MAKGFCADSVIIRPDREFSSKLRAVQPPSPVIVVAEGWPSIIPPLESLDVPVEGAFFPRAYHTYFKHKRDGQKWHPPQAFASTVFAGPVVVILSGSLEFVESVWPKLPDIRRVLVCLEVSRRGLTAGEVGRALKLGELRLQQWELHTTQWADELCGGVTDAWHLFGVGSDLADAAPSAPPNLRRSVSHYLAGKHTNFHAPLVLKTTVPSTVSARQRVLWHNGVVRGDGLFPARDPRCQVYCPSHYKPLHWAIRQASLAECLRIFQVPLKFDSDIVARFNVDNILPFEVAFPTDLLTTMLRELWGVGGGCEPGGGELEGSAGELTTVTKKQKQKQKINNEIEVGGSDCEADTASVECADREFTALPTRTQEHRTFSRQAPSP